MIRAALPSDSVNAELTFIPRPVKKNVNTASRTPNPFTDTGSIWAMNDSGTITARSDSDRSRCRAYETAK